MADDKKETKDQEEDDAEGQRHRGVMIPPSVDAEGDDAEGNILKRSQTHADLKDEDDMEGHSKR